MRIAPWLLLSAVASFASALGACGGSPSTSTPVDDAAGVSDAGDDAGDAGDAGEAGCVEGAACTPTDACRKGVTACAAGLATCTATDALPNGTKCGDGLACIGGACVTCQEGVSCLPPNPCHAGHVTCSSADRGCVDDQTALSDGTACGVGQACIAGACTAVCQAGVACTIAGSCRQGLTTCASPTAAAGSETCVETGVATADGTACAAGKVCLAGVCLACAAGVSCTPSANPCHAGTTSCATGAQTCQDSTTNVPDGTPCGAAKVCNAGVCAACADGTSCVPTSSCHLGVTKCTTGAASCVDTGAAAPAGSACAAGSVCTASGSCASCQQDAPCAFAANPCHQGKTDCASGAPVCKDAGANVGDGSSCGVDLVCKAGACQACKANVACAPSANACHVGSTSCATGTSVCVDSGSNAPDGLACAAGKFCAAGACTACSDGAACTPSASACHVGAVSCAGGKSTCVDTGASSTPGASCGTNQVCSPAGTCASCTQGAPCSYGANACHAGTTDCTSGAAICKDAGTNVSDGSSCGTNLVCKAGACTTCKAGPACTPANACHVGATSCSTGVSVCVDTAVNAPNGLGCGTNLFCNAGACGACTEGASCTPAAPGAACHLGTTSCSTGAAVCVDTGAAAPAGRSCGTNLVCAPGGSCVSCTAGTACTPVTNACHTGAIVCTSGVGVCTDSGTALANGAACGAGAVCNGGSCTTCVAGGACTPTNVCDLGVYSCATGAKVCVDAGADGSKTGSACGASGTGTCAAGACACPSGRQWTGTDCAACPAPTGSTLYVDAAIGTDNACCGALSTAGIGGACKTITQALKNVKGSAWTISANGDASSSEAYPLHLGSGLTLVSSGRIPGGAGSDIIAVDLDATTVTLNLLQLGVPIGGTPATRDGIVVRAPNATTSPHVVVQFLGQAYVGRDSFHIDGGALDYQTGSTADVGALRAGIYCVSETTPTLGSSFNNVGNLSFAYPAGSPVQYGVYAGHGCTVTRAPSVSPFIGQCPPQRPTYGYWIEDDASVAGYGANCALRDNVSVRVGPHPTETASVTISDGYVTFAGCAGIYAEQGHVSVRATSIQSNRWGVVQHTSASSSSSAAAMIDANGSSGCAHPPCTNTIDQNRNIEGAAWCCAGSASCAPPADVFNNSGLPLIATFDTVGRCPVTTCSCNSALASCTCTGGGTTPPAAGVTELLAPLTSGTPTIDTTGSACAP